MARGYAAVTLRDIASSVGIKHTSLYHHVPGGKEELFVEVLERGLQRHRAGLRRSVDDAAPSLRARLHAVSDWFLTQSPMDLVRMTQSDMPALSAAAAMRLERLVYESILVPVESILVEAHRAGEAPAGEFGLIAGGLVGMIQSLFAVPEYAIPSTRCDMGRRLMDVCIDGIAGAGRHSPSASERATAPTDPATTRNG